MASGNQDMTELMTLVRYLSDELKELKGHVGPKESVGGGGGVGVVETDAIAMEHPVIEGGVDVGQWSGSVNECDSNSGSDDSSVKMPAGSLPRDVKINFIAERDVAVGTNGASGFYSQYVRTAAVSEFVRFLEGKLGTKLKKQGRQELALSRYAVGAVPSAFSGGQVRVRAMAKLGDSILTMLVTEDMYLQGNSVADIQAAVGRMCSRSALTPLGVRSGLSRFMVLPSGVDEQTSSAVGEGVEAMMGAVYRCGGLDLARKFARELQIVA